MINSFMSIFNKNTGLIYTAWKVTKYGVIFGPNTGKYGPEITSYLGAFHAVMVRNNFHSNH